MFSIDTSSLIWGKDNHPVDVSPGFWRRIEEGIAAGALRASEAVLFELEKKDDDLHAWAKAHPELFVTIDEAIQLEVRKIIAKHPQLLNLRKNKSGGYPFVVALAILGSGTVVTQEGPTGPGGRPRIPNVCNDLGVPYVDVLGLFRQKGWRT